VKSSDYALIGVGAALLASLAVFAIVRIVPVETRYMQWVLSPKPDAAIEHDGRNRGMSQVLEVLRRRIADPIRGIRDSEVTEQRDGRVVVQIPDGQIDRARARHLLTVTGHLEFKIVKDVAQSEELLRAKYRDGLPAETQIATERDAETGRALAAYLLSEKASITGDYLEDAMVGFDRQQRPVIMFRFNAEGGRIFGDLTAEHVGEQLAIVLDDRIYSAPTIRSRIGSRGQIEGRFTPEEAADLAVILRAGSLPVPVAIEEERTVPGVRKESIAKLVVRWAGEQLRKSRESGH
jgi:preprotein translocase subunit SecD